MATTKVESSDKQPIIIDPRMLGNYYDHDDEINLVDLWLSLVEQKKVFFVTFILIFGTGFLFALLKPTIYEYSTTIDIGTKVDKETLIQPAETVKSEITSAYINQALHDYYSDSGIIQVEVENPKNTSLLLLKSSGSFESSEIHLTIHKNILQRLIQKHSATSQSIKEGLHNQQLALNNDIEDLENKIFFASKQLAVEKILANKKKALIKLQEENTNLSNSLIRFKKLYELLQNQRTTNIKHLNAALENQQNSEKGRFDTAFLVLLTSELQQSRTHITALDERLTMTIPAQEEDIKQNIADNLKEQETQQIEVQQAELALSKLYINRDRQLTKLKTEIAKIDNDLVALPVTHAIVPPSRSFEPMPSKKKLIIAVSGILAIFVGLFAALFAGFISRAQEQE